MPRHPVSRIVQLTAGVALIVASPLVGAIPGPGGIFVFAAGLALVLRNSHWARMRWVRLKRRWPKFSAGADRVMRRRSAARRRERAKAQDEARIG